MDLIFSSDDIINSRLMMEDSRVLYIIESTRTRSETIIYRLKEDFQIEVGKIKWHTWLFQTVDPEVSCHGEKIKMERAGLFTM
jgi:hypothetical protein